MPFNPKLVILGLNHPFPRCHALQNMSGVMSDKMTSMRSIWYMAKQKEMTHDTMVSSDST